MRKIISISLIIIAIGAMLQFSVSTHWCHGNIAGTKVSLTGKSAGCGMEDLKEKEPFSGLAYSSRCCKNVVNVYQITSNYFPAFQIVPDAYQQILQQFNSPERFALSDLIFFKVYSDKSPPYDYTYHSVDLAKICTLQI